MSQTPVKPKMTTIQENNACCVTKTNENSDNVDVQTILSPTAIENIDLDNRKFQRTYSVDSLQSNSTPPSIQPSLGPSISRSPVMATLKFIDEKKEVKTDKTVHPNLATTKRTQVPVPDKENVSTPYVS